MIVKIVCNHLLYYEKCSNWCWYQSSKNKIVSRKYLKYNLIVGDIEKIMLMFFEIEKSEKYQQASVKLQKFMEDFLYLSDNALLKIVK